MGEPPYEGPDPRIRWTCSCGSIGKWCRDDVAGRAQAKQGTTVHTSYHLRRGEDVLVTLEGDGRTGEPVPVSTNGQPIPSHVLDERIPRCPVCGEPITDHRADPNVVNVDRKIVDVWHPSLAKDGLSCFVLHVEAFP